MLYIRIEALMFSNENGVAWYRKMRYVFLLRIILYHFIKFYHSITRVHV